MRMITENIAGVNFLLCVYVKFDRIVMYPIFINNLEALIDYL